MATPSFGHLAKLNPTGTARYEFPVVIEGDPWLQVRRADESNKPYYNAVLALNRRVRPARSAKAQRDMLNKQVAQDRKLYPKHVIVDWGGIFDDDGNEVPFSPEAAAEFLQKLPKYLIEDLRGFCSNPENFMELDDGDDHDTGKGSPKS